MRTGLEQIPDEKARVVVAELKRRLEAIYGDRLVHVILYGSRARGDHEQYSDVDVLVVRRGAYDRQVERKRTIDAVAELSLEYDAVVHRVFASEDELRIGDKPLLESVREEGVVL